MGFTPDGRQAVSAGGGPSIRVWDVGNGRELRRIGEGDYFGGQVALSNDGKHVLFQGNNGQLRLHEIEEGKLIRSFERVTAGQISSFRFSPDDQLVLSGGLAGDRTGVRLWEVKSGRMLHVLNADSAGRWPGEFSPDGKYVLTQRATDATASQFELNLWETASGRETRTITKLRSGVQAALFTPDGKYFLCGAGGRVLSLIETATGKEIWYQLYPVSFFGLSRDGRIAVTATNHVDYQGRDLIRGIRMDFWDVATGIQLRTLQAPVQ